jgi:pyruvate/2-oxoglutarate dehydrogenase complex dihydrolipoamide acyltransferase (E2) component
MGEGIRNAKVVSLLKQPGELIALDDPLCEVETDKAIYPIESSYAGRMGEWKTEVGATVDIGQEIGTIVLEEAIEVAAETSGNGAAATAVSPRERQAPQRENGRTHIDPALTPTITRRLGRVVPANLQIDAPWEAIRRARDEAKRDDPSSAATPSVMVAWAVTRSMDKHAAFRRLMLEDDSILENAEFDLGIAVALEGDRLATAVITSANRRTWHDFVRRYNDTVNGTRSGRVDAVNAPLVISSLGAFGVRAAAPIIVPPSIATLFVGASHFEMLPGNGGPKPAEVVTLSLTFDHRVVNGAGAANFAREIAREIEQFQLPVSAGSST